MGRWLLISSALTVALAAWAGSALAHPNAQLNMSRHDAAQWVENGRADRFVYLRTPARVYDVETRRARCRLVGPTISEFGGTWGKHARCRARARWTTETGARRCMQYRVTVHFVRWKAYHPPRPKLDFSRLWYRLRCT
jgi:hypothetical protein